MEGNRFTNNEMIVTVPNGGSAQVIPALPPQLAAVLSDEQKAVLMSFKPSNISEEQRRLLKDALRDGRISMQEIGSVFTALIAALQFNGAMTDQLSQDFSALKLELTTSATIGEGGITKGQVKTAKGRRISLDTLAVALVLMQSMTPVSSSKIVGWTTAGSPFMHFRVPFKAGEKIDVPDNAKIVGVTKVERRNQVPVETYLSTYPQPSVSAFPAELANDALGGFSVLSGNVGVVYDQTTARALAGTGFGAGAQYLIWRTRAGAVIELESTTELTTLPKDGDTVPANCTYYVTYAIRMGLSIDKKKVTGGAVALALNAIDPTWANAAALVLPKLNEYLNGEGSGLFTAE